MTKEKHVCNPHPSNFFGTKNYQCGCGRYFSKEEAIKQNSKWLQAKIEEFKEE